MTYDPARPARCPISRQRARSRYAAPARAGQEESLERATTRPRPRAGRPDPERTEGRRARCAERPLAGRRPDPRTAIGGRPSTAAGDQRDSGRARRRARAARDAGGSPVPADGRSWWAAPISPRSTRRDQPNPRQPRQVFDEDALAELVHSLREVGVLQPVVVRPLGGDRYELVMGERRMAGRPAAGLTDAPGDRPRDRATTPCCATPCWRTCTAPSSTRWRRRRPTTSCSQDFGCTQDELAGRIGRSRPQISNTIRLLKLPAERAAPARRRRAERRACPGAARSPATPRPRSGWRSGSWPRASRSGRSRRSSRSVGRPAQRVAPNRAPGGPGAGRSRRPALVSGSRPGSRSTSASAGADHGGVRVDRRPRADRRDDGPRRHRCRTGQPQQYCESEPTAAQLASRCDRQPCRGAGRRNLAEVESPGAGQPAAPRTSRSSRGRH